MAPWGNGGRQTDSETKPTEQTRTDPWDEDNPFIAFRRFADEQFSILIQGVNAIPDMLSEIRSKAEDQRQHWEQQKEQSNSDSTTNLGGRAPWRSVWIDSSFPAAQSPNEESRDAARTLLLQARNANVGINPKRILSLYRDQSSAWDLSDPFEPQWLSVDWFRRSRYSPTQIETHAHAHQHGSMWRAAFEDLLSAELGKEQEAHPAWTNRVNNQSLYASWAQAPIDWMLGLQCRGVLPPQLPALYQFEKTKHIDEVFSDIINNRYSSRSRHSWHGAQAVSDFERLALEISHFDADERADQQARTAETEQDLYEAFLGKTSNEPSGRVPEQVAHSQAEAPAVIKPNIATSKILSTLSTTERTTLPDGSVTTKVVMKKRFADGREESTETVTTNHANVSDSAPGTAIPSTATSPEQDQQKKQKGWFWS